MNAGVGRGRSGEATPRRGPDEGTLLLGMRRTQRSLTVGKDADFAILSGDPFSVYTQILETWVEGKKVFDRTNPEHLLFAIGGRGAGDDTAYNCCGGEDH